MVTISDIAALLDVPTSGDARRPVDGFAGLSSATPTQISFLSSDEYLEAFRTTRAAAVIVSKDVNLPDDTVANSRGDGHAPLLMRVDDAELAVAKALSLFAPPVPGPQHGVDPTARVATSASLGAGCAVGPNVQIGQRTRIGKNCVFHAGVFISDDVVVGDDCQFFPNVVIRERITIGSRVLIHANSVIGTDGFGYAWDKKLKQHTKVPQIGTVIIEDDVEIGSCACIDRAKFAATRIGRGSKLDNLVQIAHNVTMGENVIFAGQAGIAGSAVIGNGAVIGGQVAIRDNVTVGERTVIAMCSALYQGTEPDSMISGAPAGPHKQMLRAQVALRKLPELIQQVRKLQSEMDQLRKSLKV